MRRIIPPLLLLLTACGPRDDHCEGPPFRYETRHGIRVITEGPLNSPNTHQVQTWTQQTLLFWNNFFSFQGEVPQNIYAYFTEARAIYTNEEPYGGYVTEEPEECGISYRLDISAGPLRKVSYIFAHELSHVLLWESYALMVERDHHELMNTSGFNKTLGEGYMK